MNHEPIEDQAQAIAAMLPALMRRLFTVGDLADLPLAQLRVCAILADGARPMSAMSRELGISFSAMTQIADRLERAELVCRVAASEDRRVRHLQLTTRGADLMRSRDEARAQGVLAALERLSRTQRGEVVQSLETLLGAATAAQGALAADHNLAAPQTNVAARTV